MNLPRLLLSAALMATASFAQTPTQWPSSNHLIFPTANTTAPTLTVFCIPGGIAWYASNAYYVTVSPSITGDNSCIGYASLPVGTYTVTAVGERGRSTYQVICVR